MTRRAGGLAALFLAGLSPAVQAQAIPPELTGAYALGGAVQKLQSASPCFPRVPGAEAELQRMATEARDLLRDQPAVEAYWRGYNLSATQQRHIARSDPVACEEIRAALRALVGR